MPAVSCLLPDSLCLCFQGAAGEELRGPRGVCVDGVRAGRGAALRSAQWPGPAGGQLQNAGPALTPQVDSPGAAGKSVQGFGRLQLRLLSGILSD